MTQHIEFDIEWPQDQRCRYYVVPATEECHHAGFYWSAPEQGRRHIIIERPREACGKRWVPVWDGSWCAFDYDIPSHRTRHISTCTLDAGHDGPCMMELGRTE